jgi:hypothetical protein
MPRWLAATTRGGTNPEEGRDRHVAWRLLAMTKAEAGINSEGRFVAALLAMTAISDS